MPPHPHAPILNAFFALTRIPRPSKHEQPVARHLLHWATTHHLPATIDPIGNLKIDAPPTPGYHAAPTVILQGHMDMVCTAAPHRHYNPLRDPIRPIQTGNRLTADGTSLGADDGIGIAIAQTLLLDPSFPHGPLRAIFTVEEETGMTGALGLPQDWLNAPYLLNIDWEEARECCIGAAGAQTLTFHRTLEPRPPPPHHAILHLAFTHFPGGHSGADIHRRLPNPIPLLAKTLLAANVPLWLLSFSGGHAPNAIPTRAECRVALPPSNTTAIRQALEITRKTIPNTRGLEKIYCRTTPPTPAPPPAADPHTTRDWLTLLARLPDGIRAFDPTNPNTVETSSNIGLAHFAHHAFHAEIHTRSSQSAPLRTLATEARALADATHFTMHPSTPIPGWITPAHAPLPTLAQTIGQKQGAPWPLRTAHVGLECSCFAARNPALQMLSIGPTLHHPHSPREELLLDTLPPTYAFLRALLTALSSPAA